MFSQDWKNSYAEALEVSTNQEKPIILVFSGSDWCAPCIKLDENIWQSEEFKTYSSQNYVLYKADFPRKKVNKLSKDLAENNSVLADRFNSKGHFPLVVILSPKEKVLGVMGYENTSAKNYISLINSFIN